MNALTAEVVRGQLVAERETPRLTELKRRAETLGFEATIHPAGIAGPYAYLSVRVRNDARRLVGSFTVDETTGEESEQCFLSCECDALVGMNQESNLLENARLVAAAFKALMGVS